MVTACAYLVFLVVVNKGEGEGHIEGVVFEGACGSLTRLEGNHQIYISSGSLLAEGVDALLTKYGN